MLEDIGNLIPQCRVIAGIKLGNDAIKIERMSAPDVCIEKDDIGIRFVVHETNLRQLSTRVKPDNGD